MATQVFDHVAFAAQYPEFASVNSGVLTGYWNMATGYISPVDGCQMSGAILLQVLYLLTAHIAKCFALIAAGQASGVVTSAAQGSVSVGFAPPPVRDGWDYWLSTTQYGLMLRGMLKIQSMAIQSVGGQPNAAAYRKTGGAW